VNDGTRARSEAALRFRAVGWAVLRAVASIAVVVTAYYLLPFDRSSTVALADISRSISRRRDHAEDGQITHVRVMPARQPVRAAGPRAAVRLLGPQADDRRHLDRLRRAAGLVGRLVRGLVEVFLGVQAAGKSLEQVTKPLTSMDQRVPAATVSPIASQAS
jgi:hypothetical protein